MHHLIALADAAQRADWAWGKLQFGPPSSRFIVLMVLANAA